MVNVVVGRKRNVRVTTNATAGVIDTTVPVTLKTVPYTTTQAAQTRLDHLVDVNAAAESEGAVPVYEANTDTYVIKPVNLSYVVGDLDGGEF